MPEEKEKQPGPRREFLGWGRPVVELVVDRLLEGVDEVVPDLSETLVVVPTKHAGRRLRAALAERCPGGVLSPRVVPPEFFIGATGEEAGRAVTLMAWVEVLMGEDLKKYWALFPAEPEEQSFSWALGLAEMLESVRATLAEGDVATSKAAEDLPDGARWADFGRLEAKMVGRLEKKGLMDAQAAKLVAAKEGELPGGVGRVVVAAVPDALYLAVVAMRRHLAAGVPVEVWVAAPGDMAEGFDDWGCPVGAFWQEREVGVRDFEESVFLAADPAGQAARAGEVLRRRETPGARAVALGCLDGEVIAPLTQVLHEGGVGVFDPDGEPLENDPVFSAVASFSKLLSDHRWESFREVLRQPAVLDGLGELVEKRGEVDLFSEHQFRRDRILEAFDALHQLRLPADVGGVRAALKNPINEHESKRRDYAMPKVVDKIASLMETFGSKSLDVGVQDLVAFLGGAGEVADRLIAVAGEIRGYLGKRSASNADILSFCVRLLAGERTYPPRADGIQADLLGWLELLWEDAPDLVLTGFNEGNVPDAVVGDPFLPEAGREVLGLRTNAGRFARDAYLLEALARQREDAGMLQIILGKVARDGSPLKPSRLLFLCPDADLASRTARLFGAPGEISDSSGGVPAWERTWLFRPPGSIGDMAPLPHLRVTHFSSYLDCPFRFFLKNRLKMEPLEISKNEMDARDFGTVVHVALESLYYDPAARDSTDAREIEAFLVAALDTAVAVHYGESLPTALAMQREVAAQRLKRVAEIQAVEREAGWRIEAVELDFGKEPEWGTSLAGLPIHGSIDRIERHSDGRVRILDYKTSRVGKSPEDAHFRSLPRGMVPDDFPEWRTTAGPKGKPVLWTNLQLPLYVLWARTRYPDAAITCGYFNVPAALGEIGISTWDPENFADVLGSAENCVTAVGAAVCSNTFWPPEAKPTYDDFAALAPVGKLAEALDSDAWVSAFESLPKITSA